MTDQIDRAQQLEQADRERAIARARQAEPTTGTRYCVDCDEEIPEARRKAYPKAIRCIYCQELKERRP